MPHTVRTCALHDATIPPEMLWELTHHMIATVVNSAILSDALVGTMSDHIVVSILKARDSILVDSCALTGCNRLSSVHRYTIPCF